MIEAQAHLREEKVAQMVGFLKGKEGQVVKIAEVVFGTLFNIFGNLIYSKDVFDLDDPTGGEIKGHIWRLMELGNSTNPADYYPVLGKIDLLGQRRAVADCLQQIYDIWNVIMRERREKKGDDTNNDFVRVLLDAELNDHQINALLMVCICLLIFYAYVTSSPKSSPNIGRLEIYFAFPWLIASGQNFK